MKEIIREVLIDRLKNADYQTDQVAAWTKEISNKIRDTISTKLKIERYKYVVNVFIGEQKGEGVKYVKKL